MRTLILALTAAGGLLMAASAAQATPLAIHDGATVAPRAGIVEVRGGCGIGWHPAAWRDRWGRWHRRCVRNW